MAPGPGEHPRARAALDDALMADFVNAIADVNALADVSPGFVWRLQTEAGNAIDVRAYDDPRIIFNLSVWTSLEALRDYAYRSLHGKVSRAAGSGSRSWRSRSGLWWVPAGHPMDAAEGRVRLEHLERHGPSAHAFTFRRPFPPFSPPGGLSRIK